MKNIYTISLFTLILILSIVWSLKYQQKKVVSKAEDGPAILKYSDEFKLPLNSPDIGFETGLGEYPTVTWKDNSIISNTHKSILDINYPQLIARNFEGRKVVQEVNQYVEDIVEKRIQSDDKKVRDTNKGIQPEDYMHTNLEIKYRIIGIKNKILSLEMVITDFTGGGNGDHSESVPINWDLKSDRLLKDNELFCTKDYINTTLPIVRKELIKELISWRHTVQPIDESILEYTTKFVERGTDPTNKNNDEYFLLSPNGLIVIFPAYQVSSGASGIVRILIPYSEIPNVICLP